MKKSAHAKKPSRDIRSSKTSAEREAFIASHSPWTEGGPTMRPDEMVGAHDPDGYTENALGWMPVPVGVATGFRICRRDLPAVLMATMERTVVSAASRAAMLARERGGITVHVGPNIVTGQVSYLGLEKGEGTRLITLFDAIGAERMRAIAAECDPFVKYGGGFIDIRPRLNVADKEDIVVLEFEVNAGEAMGAGMVTVMAEHFAEVLAHATKYRATSAICTNAAQGPKVEAVGYWSKQALGDDVAERMLRMYRWAARDQTRAVTHNKGIMNGVAAVALATGQDVHAIEAAAAFDATRTGKIMPLTHIEEFGDSIKAQLTMHIPLGTVGGATRLPAAKYARRVMRAECVRDLATVIGAVGLVQNIAALRCLADEGIGAAFGKHSK